METTRALVKQFIASRIQEAITDQSKAELVLNELTDLVLGDTPVLLETITGIKTKIQADIDALPQQQIAVENNLLADIANVDAVVAELNNL